MRGKGVPKIVFFLDLFCLMLFLPIVFPNWFIIFYHFLFLFWVPLFMVFGVSSVSSGSLLGVLDAFLRVLFSQKL